MTIKANDGKGDEMSKPSEEVLFYARCQLEGMVAENDYRKHRGEVVAYTEDAFVKLAEETRGAFRAACEFDERIP